MQILSGKLTDKQEFICESICCIRQGFNKNLYPHAFYLNPIGFAPISGLWIKVFVKAFPPYSFTFDTLLLLQVVRLNSASMSLLRPS